MKKFLTLLAITLLAFNLSFAQTKKDSTTGKRYKTNPAVKRKQAATTNGGKPDLRYKMNKKPN